MMTLLEKVNHAISFLKNGRHLSNLHLVVGGDAANRAVALMYGE